MDKLFEEIDEGDKVSVAEPSSVCRYFLQYRKTSNKRPTDLGTQAFNRDLAFIGDPASIRTWPQVPCVYYC